MLLDLKIAIRSLSAHKFRAILAMLGVFLGALAFTGVQTVSQIMVRNAQMEVEKMGPDLFAVMAAQVRFGKGGIRFSGSNKNLKVSDVRALMDQVPSVLDGTPVFTLTMPVRHESDAMDALVTGCWPSYQEIRSFHVQTGRFFTVEEDRSRAKVVVLGIDVAEELFGDPQEALGKTVFIYKAGFRVIGVMERKGSDLAGVNQDEQVFIPLATAMRRASNQDYVTSAYLRLAEGTDRDMIKESVRSVLRPRHHLNHGEPDDFSMIEAKEAIKLQAQALDLMSTLGIITSSISFAVGGMGILSIMILMVRARRLEIGIRRAVGGKRGDIVRQFMLESALMAVTGGVAGVLVCMGLILVFTSMTSYPLVIDSMVMVGTVAASALIGVFAGSYPAWQASRIEILDVLKVR